MPVSFPVLRKLKMFCIGMELFYKNIKTEKVYYVGLKAPLARVLSAKAET